MREPTGHYLPLPGPRKFISDLVHFARRIPSAPVAREIDVSALSDARVRHPARPSWSCVFMKAYALVGAANCAVAAIIVGIPMAPAIPAPLDELCHGDRASLSRRRRRFRRDLPAPEQQTLSQLQQAVAWYKNETLEKVGFYRMALRFSKAPTPLRRLLWWGTLNISGFKRSKRFGTFGLSSYGALGAEQIHPISPLSTTLTYGPIDPTTGRVIVKLIYDHRVLDGAYVARRLRELEETLNGPILDELRENQGDGLADSLAAPPPNVEPLLKPHFQSIAPQAEAQRQDQAESAKH